MIHPAIDDLTERQYAIWNFLRSFTDREGRSPTRREVMAEFGFKSLNALHGHYAALARKGYLNRDSGRTGIRLRCREVSIPVLSV